MTRAYNLYKRHTQDALVTMQKAIREDPAARMPSGAGSIWLFKPRHHKKLGDIAQAITFHLGDKKP